MAIFQRVQYNTGRFSFVEQGWEINSLQETDIKRPLIIKVNHAPFDSPNESRNTKLTNVDMDEVVCIASLACLLNIHTALPFPLICLDEKDGLFKCAYTRASTLRSYKLCVFEVMLLNFTASSSLSDSLLFV